MAASKKKASSTRAGKGSKKAVQPQRTTSIELIGLGIICLAVVSFVVLLSTNDPHNPVRSLLDGLAGKFSIVLPFIILWIGLITIFSSTRQKDIGKIAMIASCILLIFSMVHIFCASDIVSRLQLGRGWLNFIEQSFFERAGAGAIGALLSYPAYAFAGKWGGFFILLFVLFALIIILKQFSLRQFGERAQEYLQSSYSDFRQNQTARSAERAIVRAERRKANEEERIARREAAAQRQTWNDSWDTPLAGQKKRIEPIQPIDHTEQRNPDLCSANDEPLPRHGSVLEVPDYLKDKSRKQKKKPAFGEKQESESGLQEKAFPFSGKSSKLVASVPESEAVSADALSLSETEDFSEYLSECQDPYSEPEVFEEAAEHEPDVDLPDEYDIPIIPEEAAEYITPTDLRAPVCEESDAEYTEHEDADAESEGYNPLSVQSDAFPPFDLDDLQSPVQRERRRSVLGEPVKSDSPARKKYAPDDYVPLNEEDFYNNPWTYDPNQRLDHTPLTVPNKHKDAIPEENAPEYNYPPVDLLSLPKAHKEADREIKDQEKAEKLESTLHDFGINAKLTGIAHGPAVTRFELAPAPGVKVSRITSLSDDIALSLAALSVRIEAPIPGKAAVGVEIPNETVETVPLREVLESAEARKHPSRLAVGMGKDNSGKCIVGDIAKMPHVLIAGATGSGKSVCINCIICSILYRATPEEVRLIMIDPKMVELSIYNGIPHLLVPVVTDPKKASGALQWAVAEMTDRYNKFAERGVRDMKGYNLSLKEGEKPMPQIVIIIDELADLMMVTPGEVEDSICRLAQLARAAGIHLVIATQRPSVNVITGVIKANIPARIAFTVASYVDSRTILDVGGAEKLLGRGDMLFAPAGSNKMQRVQGAWVSDDEVHAIVEYIKARHDVEYNEEVIQHMNKAEDAAETETEETAASDECDELLAQAIEIAVEAGQASISMLQRRLRIGYARAGRLIDEMAARGIVSQSEGAKPRNVLITREQYNMMFNNDLIN